MLSRCTARVPYDLPTSEALSMIWRMLSEANGVELSGEEIGRIVERHPGASGRDVKNLLFLQDFSESF